MRVLGTRWSTAKRLWVSPALVFAWIASAERARAQETESAAAAAAPATGETPPVAAAPALAEPEAPPDFWSGVRAWGIATEEYRLRSASTFTAATGEALPSESDHDLRLFVDGGATDFEGRLGVDLSLGLWGDLNGLGNLPGVQSFASVRDRDSGVLLDVYTLAAHYTNQRWLRSLKLGRMAASHGEPTTFDGATLALLPFYSAGSAQRWLSTLELVLFGGRTNHFYQLDDELFDDWLGSAVLAVRPYPSLRLEAEYRLTREDSSAKEIDHHYSIAAWLAAGEAARMKIYGRGLNSTLSNLGLGAQVTSLEWNAGLDASADVQTVALGQLDERDDPFFIVLGESRPRARWAIDAYKRFPSEVGTFSAQLGWAGRQRIEGESGPFNRSYGRLFSTLSAQELLDAGVFAMVTAELHYNVDESNENLIVIGGSAGVDAAWGRLELGTYYQRFKYDYFADVAEREDVRTYFASATLKPWSWLRVNASYGFEQFDRDLHTFTIGLTQLLDAGGP
ncbi:MAG: hypothetical protein IT384_09260 [Deltaproteobacteria bacterium]|nr:hypothetical protein [Deltaproteobacteria bacterium]